jgi:hypothetical protein
MSQKKIAKIPAVAEEMKGGLRSAVIEAPKIATVAMRMTVHREKKNPRECIERATPRNVEGRVSLPPTAFKKAMITAAGSVKALKMNRLRTQLFVVGQSVPIEYDKQVPRMDMVRTSGIGRTPDVRFRPQFDGWSASLIIQFDDTNLDVQTVLDLVQRAGHTGVGEFRPERNGNFGTFRIDRAITDQKEYAKVLATNLVPMVALQIPEWALDADIDPALLQKVMSSQGVTPENGAIEDAAELGGD